MAAQPSQNFPWPAQTPVIAPSQSSSPLPAVSPPPVVKRSLKRRRIRELGSIQVFPGSSSNVARQVRADSAQVEDAKHQCQLLSGNDVISCFPSTNTVIAQHQWAFFVWNSRRPELTQTNRVDVYLFRADSLTQVLRIPNLVNPPDQAGSVSARVDDRWFGSDGNNWNGNNVSFPFYWLISRSDEELDGSQIPQAIFTAVQTTFADSVAASMASSSSAAAASASSALALSASLSSLSAAAATRTSSVNSPSGAANGSLQPSSAESSFPKWAIAVIVILGFFAIAATCILTFLIIRRMRRRNSEYGSNRNSMGSASPMIEHPGGNPQSPLLAGGLARQASSTGHGQRAPSIVSPDGASTISRANSAGEPPFSGADAAIMAQAFRTTLRKPDFAGRPAEEGDSPDQPDTQRSEELLNRELAEEGRDIRSVSSSRGVKVETLSDHEGTVQDHPR